MAVYLIKEGFNDKLTPTLEKIVKDYGKLKTERRNLATGRGTTDKRYVVNKARLLDRQIKSLKDQWARLVRTMGSGYSTALTQTQQKEPSEAALKRIKELHKKSRIS